MIFYISFDCEYIILTQSSAEAITKSPYGVYYKHLIESKMDPYDFIYGSENVNTP